MARFNKIQTLQAIIQTGMVPVYYNKEVEIVFDFDDCYKQLLESVEKLGYQVDKEPDGQLNISRREAV